MGAMCSSAESSDPTMTRNVAVLEFDALKAKYESAGQDHVFQMHQDLDEDMQKSLERQANTFEPQ